MTTGEHRISPVFDSARHLLLAEVINGCITSRTTLAISGRAPLIDKLIALSVDLLICGAISQKSATVIEHTAIELVAFITGKPDQVLAAYRHRQALQSSIFTGMSLSSLCNQLTTSVSRQ